MTTQHVRCLAMNYADVNTSQFKYDPGHAALFACRSARRCVLCLALIAQSASMHGWFITANGWHCQLVHGPRTRLRVARRSKLMTTARCRSSARVSAGRVSPSTRRPCRLRTRKLPDPWPYRSSILPQIHARRVTTGKPRLKGIRRPSGARRKSPVPTRFATLSRIQRVLIRPTLCLPKAPRELRN